MRPGSEQAQLGSSKKPLPVPDVTLEDEHASIVKGLGQVQLEDLRLQVLLQEILNLEAQNVIQLHFARVQYADADQPPQQGIDCKEEHTLTSHTTQV